MARGLCIWLQEVSYYYNYSFISQYLICYINRKYANIYIGWGQKYQADSFNPELPPSVQEEFPVGADITEATDPTTEQEQALWAAQKEAQEQQEEEEEPDDEDDDD